MNKSKRNRFSFVIIFSLGLFPALICQFFVKKPVDRYIHITSYRYGKSPSIIRCNRGDRLHLTFSTNDTGHSFFLEEFDVDAKVSPAVGEVAVFSTKDPTKKPVFTKELVLIAQHQGVLNYVISKSNYRCHVWCGPMHAFEQGKLIIFPNTLLVFSLGCLIGIVFLWTIQTLRFQAPGKQPDEKYSGLKDLLLGSNFFKKIIIARWPQAILTILAMMLIYIVILTSVFGTKVSGRNLGVLMMWAIWLFILVAILTPFGGRLWCTICPLPYLGDIAQRKSLITGGKRGTKGYNNRFSGFFLKWPTWLSNNWLRLIVFLILATFSATLVTVPAISGVVVIMLVLVPLLMSVTWELRAFCRYVCPVSVFVGPYSRMSLLSVRNKSQIVCDQCKPHYCQKGSREGWACPYGINVGELNENTDCGLCLECTRSCLYNNVSLFRRPFASELGTRTLSEAWLNSAIYTVAIIYSIVYLGPWPLIRDSVNITDKHNWNLFGYYSLTVWIMTLVIIPGIFYLLSYAGVRISKIKLSVKEVFQSSSGSLLPLGLMMWIAFVIPMFFVNRSFIAQSISDPFGWGWDFFGTANIPWHQLLPRYIPWFQAVLVLAGLYFSLRNIRNTWIAYRFESVQLFRLTLPTALFVTITAVFMLFFFTN